MADRPAEMLGNKARSRGSGSSTGFVVLLAVCWLVGRLVVPAGRFARGTLPAVACICCEGWPGRLSAFRCGAAGVGRLVVRDLAVAFGSGFTPSFCRAADVGLVV